MEREYLELRDKTFIMLASMDAEQQQAYALTLQNYLEDEDAYGVMMQYMVMFNTEVDLASFMDEHVSDTDVVSYDHRLHPDLIEAREELDRLNVSNNTDDQDKARNLAYFLLADMNDDYGWDHVGEDNDHKPNGNGLYNHKVGESGPDHSSNGYEM